MIVYVLESKDPLKLRLNGAPGDRSPMLAYYARPMDNPKLDELQQAYKQAVDQWVGAIRAEEALATPNHSETAMEMWDRACFAEQDAQKKASEAKEAYKDGLRKLNYGF
jgi:hypothetical protein